MPIGTGSFEIARLSAGGCLAALDALAAATVDNAYCLVRPPGHHAEKDLARGFCVFANNVLTAQRAQREHKMARIAIVDWDVHHGNSQEHAFLDDPSVLTVSVHQDNYYPPNSGMLEENGKGRGAGANINVPLPPGSGHGAYVDAWQRDGSAGPDAGAQRNLPRTDATDARSGTGGLRQPRACCARRWLFHRISAFLRPGRIRRNAGQTYRSGGSVSGHFRTHGRTGAATASKDADRRGRSLGGQCAEGRLERLME